jgi:hypothetical protein
MLHLRVFGAAPVMERVAERLQPGRLSRRRESSAVVWADLLGQAGEQARPAARFLMLMAVAGVIAAYGVFGGNGILVVGTMA